VAATAEEAEAAAAAAAAATHAETRQHRWKDFRGIRTDKNKFRNCYRFATIDKDNFPSSVDAEGCFHLPHPAHLIPTRWLARRFDLRRFNFTLDWDSAFYF